jgi:AmiR/NasT family two-component response regulator
VPSSLARKIRALDALETAALSSEERLQLVQDLHDEAVQLLMQGRGVDESEALRLIARGHKSGRRKSVLNAE